MSCPFRVLGLQQIAIGSSDKNILSKLWVDLFQMKKETTIRLENENTIEDILFLGKKPFHVEIDLMQPIDPNQKPNVQKPPLHHIGLWIDELKLAYDWLIEQGIRFTLGGIRQGASGHDVCFIHPKGNQEYPISGNGVLIELVQAPEEVKKAYENQ